MTATLGPVWETILGSAVVAAIISGIITGVLKIFDLRREDSIRAQERSEARADRAAEVELQDRRDVAAREAERLKTRTTEGRAHAKILLAHLEALEAHLDGQPQPGTFGTYHWGKELSRPIRMTTRLLPDAEFREYLDLAMQVASELWVAASVGEGSEEPWSEQRKILRGVADQVGRYITDDGWDHGLIVELQSTKDALDEYWDEYERR